MAPEKKKIRHLNLLHNLGEMAKKLELSDPRVAALMGQQKKLIPWVSVNYNDEQTLLDLRCTNPAAEWSVTRDLFNECVPPKRKRTIDAIKNKWKVLKAKSNKEAVPMKRTFLEALPEDSSTIQVAPAVTVPENYLPSQYIEEKSLAMQAVPAQTSYNAFEENCYDAHTRDQAVESLDAQNEAEYYDILSTNWDSMADFDGYLMGIANDLEKMEAARSVAIAAASGMLAWSE